MPATLCAVCHDPQPDIAHYWTEVRGAAVFVCLFCLAATLERGLNAIAYVRDEGKGRHG